MNPESDQDDAPLFESNINFRYYWQTLLERRWLVLTTFLSIFVLAIIYLFRATPIYRATTQIEIGKENPAVLRMDGLAIDRSEQDYLQTQYKKLMSRSLLDTVAINLDLKKQPQYSESEDLAQTLFHQIDVTPVRLTRLVNISAENREPQLAAQIANELANSFIQASLDQKIAASTDVVVRLQDEALKQKAKVETAEAEVNEYRATNSISSFENAENIVLQALKQYQADLDQATSQSASSKTVIEEIDRVVKAGAPLETIPQISSDVAVQQLKLDRAKLESEFAELKKRYLERHPKYIAMVSKLGAIDQSIAARENAIIESLRNQANMDRARVQQLQALLNTQKQRQQDLKKLQVQYSVLKREAETSALLYNSVLETVKSQELLGRNAINNIHVVDKAIRPLSPVKPRIALTLVLGALGGMAVAIGLAFFVSYLDDSVKSQEDVEMYLKVPFLGYVPNIKTNSVEQRDLQTHYHPQSDAAEAFRTVRATISLARNRDALRVLTVTSTIPSEGKSLVASNLAIVTAQTGMKTVLIDADLRRPSVHKAFQLHSPVGLSAYLLGEEDRIEKIAQPTEVPNLDTICCGAIPNTPSELISSTRMKDLLEQLRGRYDRIYLDSPPVSAVSDPLLMAAMSDGIVYVTKFNKIRREFARKSIQRIEDAGIHVVGLVLNDIDFEGRDAYYYSYYYYQNRYYMSHYKTGPSTARRGQEEPVGQARNGG